MTFAAALLLAGIAPPAMLGWLGRWLRRQRRLRLPVRRHITLNTIHCHDFRTRIGRFSTVKILYRVNTCAFIYLILREILYVFEINVNFSCHATTPHRHATAPPRRRHRCIVSPRPTSPHVAPSHLASPLHSAAPPRRLARLVRLALPCLVSPYL